MTSKNAFLNGRWVPADSRITYQNFKHWEAAMRQSHEMGQTQADGRHLRQLFMCDPGSPAFTPQATADNETQFAYEVDPEALIFRLARNRPALDALRRTRKMRYRHNLKFLAANFPLADELAKKEKQAKNEAKNEAQKEAEKAQGLTTAEILAQKELAKKKIAEKTVEELKYIREMKAAKVKAAASDRLKEKEAKDNITAKKTEKVTGKSSKETAGKKLENAARKSAEKTGKSAEKSAGKSVESVVQSGAYLMPPNVFAKTAAKTAGKSEEKSFCPMPPNVFALPKTAGKSTKKATGESDEESGESDEETAPKTVKKTASKSTGSTAGRKSGKKSLYAKMMPKMRRW